MYPADCFDILDSIVESKQHHLSQKTTKVMIPICFESSFGHIAVADGNLWQALLRSTVLKSCT